LHMYPACIPKIFKEKKTGSQNKIHGFNPSYEIVSEA